MSMSEAEVLRLVLDWLKDNVDQQSLTRLFEDIPAAHVILNEQSYSQRKLDELRRLEGTED